MGPDLMAKFQAAGRAVRHRGRLRRRRVARPRRPRQARHARQRRGARGQHAHLRDRLGVPQARPARRGDASRATASRGAPPATASSSSRRRSRSSAAATRRWRRRRSSPASRTRSTSIHRRDTLRASKIMQQRAFDNEKIEFIWNAEVAAIHGATTVTGVTCATPSRHGARPRPRRPLRRDRQRPAHPPRARPARPDTRGHHRGRGPQLEAPTVPGVFAAGDVDRPHLPAGGHRRRHPARSPRSTPSTTSPHSAMRTPPRRCSRTNSSRSTRPDATSASR